MPESALTRSQTAGKPSYLLGVPVDPAGEAALFHASSHRAPVGFPFCFTHVGKCALTSCFLANFRSQMMHGYSLRLFLLFIPWLGGWPTEGLDGLVMPLRAARRSISSRVFPSNTAVPSLDTAAAASARLKAAYVGLVLDHISERK